ncbi:MAG: PbsX family transcriptional regulator [Hyphomicrobiales bacterium]|nr:PbsX family transcriptional regulator [Hyphomicrobiales bacterium]
MNAQARFTQWGNSLAVRIPSGIARELHAFDGRPARLEVKGGSLVVTPLDVVPKYDLNALIEGITPENFHGETDTGDSLGNEYP